MFNLLCCVSVLGQYVAWYFFLFSFFGDMFQKNLWKRLSQGRKHEKSFCFFRFERGRYFIYFGVRPATLMLAFSHMILLQHLHTGGMRCQGVLHHCTFCSQPVKVKVCHGTLARLQWHYTQQWNLSKPPSAEQKMWEKKCVIFEGGCPPLIFPWRYIS